MKAIGSFPTFVLTVLPVTSSRWLAYAQSYNTNWRTLTFDTNGSVDRGVGYAALFHNTTGNDNVALGYGALLSNTTGIGNIALGTDAMPFNTTGGYNAATKVFLHFMATQQAASTSPAAPMRSTQTPRATTTPPAATRRLQQHHRYQQHCTGKRCREFPHQTSHQHRHWQHRRGSDSSIIGIGTTGSRTDTYLTGVVHATICSGSCRAVCCSCRWSLNQDRESSICESTVAFVETADPNLQVTTPIRLDVRRKSHSSQTQRPRQLTHPIFRSVRQRSASSEGFGSTARKSILQTA